MAETHSPPLVTAPCLERHPEQGGPVERVVLAKVPFTIGRSDDADYTVYSNPVSKLHASILEIRGRYAVRDLQSTNGTFVNGTRVEEQFLEEGDIIHFAHVEFCFRQHSSVQPIVPHTLEPASDLTQALPLARPASLIRGAQLLRDMIASEAADTVYEPIVDLGTKEVVGYEGLSRGTHPELPISPAALFSLAEQCGMAVELSQMFRRLSAKRSDRLPRGPKLFLNVHAREVADPGFATSLSTLAVPAGRGIVMEIAESSITNPEVMANHRAAFRALDFELAYDDFGAGYARLIELTDVPPSYLKLDRSLIYGIEAQARQDMVGALISVAESLDVRVIAEGIETPQAADICSRLGCNLGQGYLYYPPAPPASVRHRAKRPVRRHRTTSKRDGRRRSGAR